MTEPRPGIGIDLTFNIPADAGQEAAIAGAIVELAAALDGLHRAKGGSGLNVAYSINGNHVDDLVAAVLQGKAETFAKLDADLDGEQPSITCPKCGMTSHSAKDVEMEWCGNCELYHVDLYSREPISRWNWPTRIRRAQADLKVAAREAFMQGNPNQAANCEAALKALEESK